MLIGDLTGVLTFTAKCCRSLLSEIQGSITAMHVNDMAERIVIWIDKGTKGEYNEKRIDGEGHCYLHVVQLDRTCACQA